MNIKSNVKVVIIFQKKMVSGPDHDRNNNFFDNCYQIQKLQRKGKGVIATKTLPGTITLSSPTEYQTLPGLLIVNRMMTILKATC